LRNQLPFPAHQIQFGMKLAIGLGNSAACRFRSPVHQDFTAARKIFIDTDRSVQLWGAAPARSPAYMESFLSHRNFGSF